MRFVVRSLLILLALYGVLFAVVDMTLAGHAPLWLAVLFALAFVGLQYLVAPKVIDFVMSIYWSDLPENRSDFPAAHREFLEQLCAKRGLRLPRIGIVYSGTPNAFSYGRTPGDARIVVTTGLLDLLTPAEVNAVIAHELGHVEHWDFVVMTIAAVVPLVLYQIYIFGRRINNSLFVGETAYAAFLVSQFVVLLLNRTREYFADAYAANVTGTASDLSTALVKIACGLVNAKETGSSAPKDKRLGDALAIMGISNVRSGAALVLGISDAASAARVMRWDLVNPWSRVFEMNSTHPLTAFRVRALGRLARGGDALAPYQLAEDRPMSYAPFMIEALIWVAPIVSGMAFFLSMVAGARLMRHGIAIPPYVRPDLLILTGVLFITRTLLRYRGAVEQTRVASLLEDVSVSEMRPRAVELSGEIVGRGLPGAAWSADLVLQDSTGIVFVLNRQSIPFARLVFAFCRADNFIGQHVTLTGWYRRGVKPYVELGSVTTTDGKTYRSRSRYLQIAAAATMMAAGWYWLMSA
jgi:heat shock protein HtpX